ncbi:hypothetical protein K440DRAFT_598042 [Wilcoxina mikolae CBS 423.85]|nr:hypothetical protein K440DRAFT_598042 [Wilcoxina mikolae CBS 423.85]
MTSPESSYADIAASGPAQSAEEVITRRANPVDEVIPTDQSIESLIDVHTGVAVVPSDFREQEVKTETQAQRLEAEAAAAEERAIKAAEEKKRQAAAAEKEKEKKEPSKAEKKQPVKSYASNPIVLGNGLGIAIVSIVLGLGAYKKHQSGQLNWKLAGTWGLLVATLAGADYCLSNYLFKKYPFGQKKNQ